MATIKTIKNNYNLLTKQERFGLYQKALLRRDENEVSAIYAATPMKEYKVIDFYFIREEIYRIDTVNMLCRLGHKEMFDLFIRFAGDREETESDYLYNAASMSAYLYVIETDAWTTVCDDLGLEVQWFRSLASEISYAVEMMEAQDSLMRDLAFSEEDAREFMKESARRLKVKDFINMKTLEQQTKFYRDFIDEL